MFCCCLWQSKLRPQWSFEGERRYVGKGKWQRGLYCSEEEEEEESVASVINM